MIVMDAFENIVSGGHVEFCVCICVHAFAFSRMRLSHLRERDMDAFVGRISFSQAACIVATIGENERDRAQRLNVMLMAST